MKVFDPSKGMFVVSLCLSAFAYGVATGKFQIFPFSVLREAKYALLAVVEVLRSDDQATSQGLGTPTVKDHAGVTDDGLILVTGDAQFRTRNGGNQGYLAWLMDRSGTVRHVWTYDNDLWSDLKDVIRPPGAKTFPVGVHLYPNGDVLANFHGLNCWPPGIGMAKFDKDSRLIWKSELHTHHWFAIGDDGRVYVPAHRTVDSPYDLGELRAKLIANEGKVLLDRVLVLDPDGTVLEEISVTEALLESGWIGLFQGATLTERLDSETSSIRFVAWDPTHLNSVRVVTRQKAGKHPLLEEGDLLLSLRNLNAVGILDAETRRFKWLSAGAVLWQHCPRLVDGGILLFDNWGGLKDYGGSRIARIDLSTNLTSTVFPRPEMPIPDRFHAAVNGYIDLHPDERRILATLAESGSLWEIDLSTGQVLWECNYPHPRQPGRGRHLYSAQYVSDVNFPLNGQGERP